MSKPDTRLERLDDIERKLAQRPKGASTGELAREYGVNVSTIRRDFMLMQSMGTAVERKGRRYVLNRRRALHQVKFTNNEVLALYLAARLLSRHSDEHNPHVITVLEKLADVLKNKSPLMSRHIEQAAAAVRERQARPEYLEALEALTEGWAEGRKVWLRYRSFKNEITERVVTRHKALPERNQSFASFRQTAEVSGHVELRSGFLPRILTTTLEFSRQGFASTFVQTANFCGNASSVRSV